MVQVTLLENKSFEFNLNKNDVEIIYTKGTGNGGQHKNKVLTCVILKHIPTNISIRIDGRSRVQNEKIAWDGLYERLHSYYQNIEKGKSVTEKRNQIGNQDRSNRIRTYNIKNDMITDHITNKTITVKELYKGNIDKLHK